MYTWINEFYTIELLCQLSTDDHRVNVSWFRSSPRCFDPPDWMNRPMKQAAPVQGSGRCSWRMPPDVPDSLGRGQRLAGRRGCWTACRPEGPGPCRWMRKSRWPGPGGWERTTAGRGQKTATWAQERTDLRDLELKRTHWFKDSHSTSQS